MIVDCQFQNLNFDQKFLQYIVKSMDLMEEHLVKCNYKGDYTENKYFYHH